MSEKDDFIPVPPHVDPNIVFHCSAEIYSRHRMGAPDYQENQLIIELPRCLADNARNRITCILSASVLRDTKDGGTILVVTQAAETIK